MAMREPHADVLTMADIWEGLARERERAGKRLDEIATQLPSASLEAMGRRLVWMGETFQMVHKSPGS